MFRGSLCLAHHVGSLCKRQFVSGTLVKMTLGLAVVMLLFLSEFLVYLLRHCGSPVQNDLIYSQDNTTLVTLDNVPLYEIN